MLTVRAGLRYTRDDKENRTIGTLTDDAVPGIPFQIIFENYDVAAEASFDAFTPRVVVEWRPVAGRELMAYASWSEGFKSGGFDTKVSRASEAGRPIREETATNVELGVKSRWLDDRLQVNAAVFSTDFHDLQRITLLFDAVSGVFDGLRVKNAGRASISGAELELAWAPSGSLLLNLALRLPGRAFRRVPRGHDPGIRHPARRQPDPAFAPALLHFRGRLRPGHGPQRRPGFPP